MAIKELRGYSDRVQGWWRASLSSFENHEIVEHVGEGSLQRWRCARPGRINLSFEVIQSSPTPGSNNAVLVICGDIGNLLIGRFRGSLEWLLESYGSLGYVAEKCEAGEIREYVQEIAERNLRELIGDRESDTDEDGDDDLLDLDEFSFDDERGYYEAMRDAGDDEPAPPFDFTLNFVRCVAAGSWLADKVLRQGSAA